MVITPKQYRDLIDKDSDLKMVSESQGELKGETWIRFTMKEKKVNYGNVQLKNK